MYNPDATIGHNDSPEISISPDRQDKLEKLRLLLHDKCGYGVTRVGDRLTIRELDYHIEMVILEVRLNRDDYIPENK